MITLYTFLSVLTVSVVSLVGAFTLILKKDWLDKSISVLVGIAIGALLGDVFIHIIPEAYEEISDPTFVPFLVIAGILIFFTLEKFIHWHHHSPDHAEQHTHPVGKMILLGDGVHNFIDGLIIASSYMISVEVGIATTLAVILHEIPQEIGNFGVLLHAGFSKNKALWYNFLSALTAVLGASIALLLGNLTEDFALWLLPLTAGGFIYIALSDLIPELHKDRRVVQTLLQTIAIVLGALAMVALIHFE